MGTINLNRLLPTYLSVFSKRVNLSPFNVINKNFNEEIKQNIKRVKGLPKIKGVKEILYPGQNKQKRFKKNVNKKIYISENIKNDLESLIAS